MRSIDCAVVQGAGDSNQDGGKQHLASVWTILNSSTGMPRITRKTRNKRKDLKDQGKSICLISGSFFFLKDVFKTVLNFLREQLANSHVNDDSKKTNPGFIFLIYRLRNILALSYLLLHSWFWKTMLLPWQMISKYYFWGENFQYKIDTKKELRHSKRLSFFVKNNDFNCRSLYKLLFKV